ncbi:ATP-binding protein [Streptomyces melanogenes]|uniref:ATP-binding protein n=1 Tax=Streptomyces melanogenes TaxID=67326 RepID=UPI00167EDA40|nr:ATP-binding protein [Streptomyces melanogenes]GGP89741.1 hypothetical protein GCM10010278_80180 [Streptomyces melanogenes]
MFNAAPSPAGRIRTPRPSPPLSPAAPHGCRRVRWAVRPTAAAVPAVRASVRTVLDGWCVASDRGEVLLLTVSELVTNAVRHAGAVTGRLYATLTLGGGWLRFEVADGDPALPCVDRGFDVDVEVDAEAEGGRGLMIVGLLAGEAGGGLVAFRAGTGKVVGVRVPAA